jgi:5-methylcytosine-specific restriction enzyme A
MDTYLLVWNPDRWKWAELSKQANQTAAGKIVTERWSCGNTKRIQNGDRVFLIRLGVEPKGIIGSGWVSEPPKLTKHWDEEKANEGEQNLSIICEWERIIDPEIDLPLPLSRLQQDDLGNVHWTPQSSGMQIPSLEATELERLWAAHLETSSLGAVFTDDEISAFEGEERIAFVRHRRREQKLRTAKLTQARQQSDGKLRCEVLGCGFDFEKVYAELGKDFAHVHHLKPLAERSSPSETSLTDLVVVCANCHAMIHRGGKCRPLANLIP